MQQFAPLEELFKGRHFDQEIVVLCVRWYLSFKLSYRDLAAMMAERGIDLAQWLERRITLVNSRSGPETRLARTLWPNLFLPDLRS